MHRHHGCTNMYECVKPVGRTHFLSSALLLTMTKDSMGNNKEQQGREKAKALNACCLISGLPLWYLFHFFNWANTSEGLISHSGLATAPTGGEAPPTIRWAALRCLIINTANKVHAERLLPTIPHLPEETGLTFRPLEKYCTS